MLVESPAWGTAPRCGDGNTRHGASLLLRTADRSEMQPPSLSQSFAPVGHPNHVEAVALDEGPHDALRQVESPWVQQ